MNNPGLLSPADRLKGWRKFRESLTEDDLNKIINWWSMLPFIDRSIDIYDSKNWPNPWELVYYGDYCKSSISLGIAYTLILVDESWRDKIKILMVDDQGLDIFLTVLINDKYLLNYSYKEITKIETLKTNVKFIETFSCNGSLNFITNEEMNEKIL